MKLHLGAGKRRIPGYLNVDIDPANEPDVVADAFTFGPFIWPHGQVEVVFACHVLEHAGRHQYKGVLLHWHSLLKPGGILRLSVPDLAAAFKRYARDSHYHNKTEDLTELLGFLYGGQQDEHDYHKMGWDEATLIRDLLEAGFREVRRYDRDKTEHADVDDLSACYLPHLKDCRSMEEYRKGVLLSLNLEATK